VLGAVVQLALTGFVVRNLGIGAAILFLPAGLLLSSIGVLAYPGLITTMLVLGVNNIFEHSIYRVGRELLYLPLTIEARKKVKVFIDVFADKCGRGVAGLIILVIAGSLPGILALRSTAAVVILLSALCVLLSLWLRRSYQGVLREHLVRREVDLTGTARFVEDPGAVRLLIAALEGPGERQILYALSLLQSMRGIDFSRHLLPLLRHQSPFIREEAARTLSALPGDHCREAEELLTDGSDRVRAAAIEYICSGGPDDPSGRVDALLQKGDTGVRIATARWLAENPQIHYIPTSTLVEELRNMSGPQSAGAHAAAAFLGGRLPAALSVPFLRRQLNDPEPEVARAAAKAAAGSGHTDLICDLACLLKNRKCRAAAREALVVYGPRIVGTLGDLLADQKAESQVRREIPWVLGRIVTMPSCELLLRRLDDSDKSVRYRSVKALNRMREHNPDLPPFRPAIDACIFAETREFYQALVACQSLAEPLGRGTTALLVKSLRERMERNLELIFRLLGLQYPMRDIYSAYSALRGTRPAWRTAAIEFLDSLLRQDLRAVILPLLEESSPERLIEIARRDFDLRPRRREEVLRTVLEHNDEWLVACALHEAGSTHEKGLENECRRFAEDDRPLVRETAAWAVRQLES
jgi:HEAT repeat protein